MKLKEKVKMLGLEAPKSFFETDEATLGMMVGGCGPGTTGDYFVPDTVWGLSIRSACIVHDYMYQAKLSKAKADRMFLFNMLKIVNDRSRNRVLRWVRRYRIMTYYCVVVETDFSKK